MDRAFSASITYCPPLSDALSVQIIMTMLEIETKKIEKALAAYLEKHRPPVHIRPQLDLGYRITRHSVELFEIRPRWDKPEVIFEHSFAKATYVRTQRTWKIYWMRADLKWHRYEPVPEVDKIEKFLEVVEKDQYCCFKG